MLCVECAGQTHNLTVRRDGDLLTLTGAGEVVTLRIVAQRKRAAARSDGHGDHRITATLPGQVAEVRCAIGDSVRTGDVLIVLDSMKLLHPLAAAVAGRVRELFCAVGDTVEGGAVLVDLEPTADPSTLSVSANP